MRNLRIILLYVAIFLGALSLGEAAGGVKARPARTTRGKPKVPLGPMEARRAAKSRSGALSAVSRRSLTKYVTSDPLWTAQMGCTATCWLTLAASMLSPALRVSNGHIRAALLVLAAKNYLGLLADMKDLVEAAYSSAPDADVIRSSVKELMGSPGAASYALYSLSVLLLMDTVPYTLYPLLLREAWATYAVAKDLLYITGVLTKSGGEEDEGDEGDKNVDRKQIKGLGSARRPPPVFYSVGLALEVGVGVMLLLEHLVGRRKLAWRAAVGLMLYLNFIIARATQIPKLGSMVYIMMDVKAAQAHAHLPWYIHQEGKATVTRATGLLLSSMLDDLESSAQALSSEVTEAMEKVAPGVVKVLDTEATEDDE